MDKEKLNQEIVLCRSIVKRAKVCVIRKLIKKIKLLRSCKKEELREKKLRKGRRLAAEVHMMRTLRPDYVTKFALLTENYVPTGSNTKLKRKRNACAKLVKHKDLVARINSIRDKFSNWREELPILLKSSKRKKAEDEEPNAGSNETNNFDKSDQIIVNKDELSNGRLEGHQDEEPASENEAKNEVTKIEKDKEKKQKVTKKKPKNESSETGNAKKKVKKKKNVDDDVVVDEDIKNNNSDSEYIEQKIEDPFFIGKMVTVPKLLQKGNENHPENEIVKETKQKLISKDVKDLKPRRGNESDSKRKNSNEKHGESITEDELHPSWKAKKIQMIKPFEGKKIKFE